MELEAWFETLWKDYRSLAPRVSSIKAMLEDRGETVLNDHIAFRTYDIGPIALVALAPHLEALGYRRFDDYRFEAKRVRATAFVHPTNAFPRIFLSELETSRFPATIQDEIRSLVDQAEGLPDNEDVFVLGRPWSLDLSTYSRLAEVSEYAAWVAAHGIRPNHFTVAVNALTTFEGLPDLLDFVESAGFALNTAGSRIKGSPADFLEQGPTLADQIDVDFGGRVLRVPSCYYEFAFRHRMPDGALFNGFVEASADKIFESTNRSE